MNDPFSDDTLLARWISGELSPAEEKELRAHPDFPAFERLARAGQRLRAPEYAVDAQLHKLREARSGAVRRTLPPRSRKKWIPYAAVATVLLLVVVFFLLRPIAQPEVFLTAAGEREQLALPDGSQVTLNADSRLTFALTDAERRLELTGEAFFDVESGERPFLVETSLGTVRVLGTRFNVRSRDALLTVTCTEGRVAVTGLASKEEYVLAAGQRVSLTATASSGVAAQDTALTLGWLQGSPSFQSVPLVTVIEELERQFDLDIRLDPAIDAEQLITTTFRAEGPVDDALDTVFGVLPDVTYVRDGRRVTVSPN